MNSEWTSRYEAAVEAARQAGSLALTYYESNLEVEWKQDHSPVTRADRETESLLRKVLLSKFPTDGFLGEEQGDQPGTSGYRWIVDPIDGTRSFVRGIPIWATLVGLEYKEEPIAGVCFIPVWATTYRALKGDGAYRDDRRIHVSAVADLKDSMLFYSSSSWFQKTGKVREFLDLAGRVQRSRGFGDFYGFVLVAQGSGELMVDHGVHVWDVAGIKVIVEEAGGKFSDWEGNPSIHRPDVIASNGKVHEAALGLLR